MATLAKVCSCAFTSWRVNPSSLYVTLVEFRVCFILTTICDSPWTFSIESSYGAFSVPNFVFEKALIFICMCALVILSLETQWHSGVDAWVGHAYHTDTRLAAVFMSNRLPVVCH